MNVNPREILNDLKASKMPRIVEPSSLVTIREEVRKDFVCKFCGASRRADVSYRPDLSDNREIAVEIECRAFIRDKGNPEVCGNIETRYYSR